MKSKSKELKYGFIYLIFDSILIAVFYLNLVELFKVIAKKINNKESDDENIRIKNTAIDIFIILKWVFILMVWSFGVCNYIVTIIVFYLILMNLYTYFYYHVWDEDSLNSENYEKGRIRNRFKNLLQAFGFSIYCYSYLFQIPFYKYFSWPNNISSFSKSLLFSTANSLTVNYDGINPIGTIGNALAISEIVISFIFITIILSRSLHQANSQT
jgi:hypothetical protein